MFSQRILFVVGAGGSYELGLPTGDTLKGDIASRVGTKFSKKSGGASITGNQIVMNAMSQLAQENRAKRPSDYVNAGNAIQKGMHHAPSIDHYLHTHQNDQVIVEVGKLGIAQSILEAERASYLSVGNTNSRINFEGSGNSWHKSFCKLLFQDVTWENLPDALEKLSFLTFNYDRCIERYLGQAVSEYFLKPPSETEKVLQKLTIVHPYGQVGMLPSNDNCDKCVPFGSDLDGRSLIDISRQIRTFTEGVGSGEFEKIKKLCREADKIVFLGFAYSDLNMQLLARKDRNKTVQVYGTTFGLTGPQNEMVKASIQNIIRPRGRNVVHLAGMTCYDFLNSYGSSITAE